MKTGNKFIPPLPPKDQGELFQVNVHLSPRLKWMKEHDITVHKSPSMDNYEAFVGCHIKAVEDYAVAGETSRKFAYGETEDEALAALVSKMGIKLWNQE